jgi:hypothetical protein
MPQCTLCRVALDTYADAVTVLFRRPLHGAASATGTPVSVTSESSALQHTQTGTVPEHTNNLELDKRQPRGPRHRRPPTPATEGAHTQRPSLVVPPTPRHGHRDPHPPQPISPNSPILFPPKPYLVPRDTLCSCEAYGMRPMYKKKKKSHIHSPAPAKPGTDLAAAALVLLRARLVAVRAAGDGAAAGAGVFLPRREGVGALAWGGVSAAASPVTPDSPSTTESARRRRRRYLDHIAWYTSVKGARGCEGPHRHTPRPFYGSTKFQRSEKVNRGPARCSLAVHTDPTTALTVQNCAAYTHVSMASPVKEWWRVANRGQAWRVLQHRGGGGWQSTPSPPVAGCLGPQGLGPGQGYGKVLGHLLHGKCVSMGEDVLQHRLLLQGVHIHWVKGHDRTVGGTRVLLGPACQFCFFSGTRAKW